MKTDVKITDYKCNQLGISKLFADLYAECIRYNVDRKKYYIYDEESGRWKEDIYEQVNVMVQDYISIDLYRMIESIKDPSKKKKYRKYIDTLQSNTGIEAIVRGLRRAEIIRVKDNVFDSKPRYLNCLNYVLDFASKKKVEHDSGLMLSQQCNIIIDSKCVDLTWKHFLMDIVCQDEKLYEYILRMIDYAMRGNPTEDCMFILYGPTTRNGKSTFINGLIHCMGSYAITAKPEDISKETRSSSGPRPELVRLKGKRLICIGEASNNQRLDVAVIKSLTGGDIITARKLYSDYEEFVNRGVFFLHTNHLPLVDDETLFQSNRVIVVPFDAQFLQDDIDSKMEEKLKNSKAISGLFLEIHRIRTKYKNINIKEDLPKRVTIATNNFENKSDYIRWFIKENIIKQSGGFVYTEEIYDKFRKWSLKNDIPNLSQKALTTKLKQKGFQYHRRNNGTGFKDIELK